MSLKAHASQLAPTDTEFILALFPCMPAMAIRSLSSASAMTLDVGGEGDGKTLCDDEERLPGDVIVGEDSGVVRLRLVGMFPLEGVVASIMVGCVETGTPEGGEGLQEELDMDVALTGDDWDLFGVELLSLGSVLIDGLVLVTLFGFRLRVCIPSFLIARGRLTECSL